MQKLYTRLKKSSANNIMQNEEYFGKNVTKKRLRTRRNKENRLNMKTIIN